MSVDARPAREDLYLYAGDDFTLTLTVTDAAGNPVDLTGSTISGQVRASDGSMSAPFVATVAANVITLTLPHTATALLTPSAVWDVQQTSAGGTITTLATGKVWTTTQVTP